MTQHPVKNKDCPSCGGDLRYSEESSRFCCSACSGEFDLPGSAGAPQTIFLSYAHRSEDEDDFDVSEELVLLVKKELERDGHDVWFDRERLKPGSQWRERITSAILDHTHFMSCLSIRSVRDPGVCLNEIATALASSRHIQTVLAEDERLVVPPLTISHIQWHDFQKWRQIRSGHIQGADGDNWEIWFAKRMSEIRTAVRDAGNTRVSGELEKLRDILDPRSFESRIAAGLSP